MQNYSDAAFNLGKMLEDGRGELRDDMMAASWYRHSFAGPFERSIGGRHNLAALLWRGMLGVPSDEHTAIELWREAALEGVSSAAYNLGVRFAKGGSTTPKSDSDSQKWFARAAELGDTDAMMKLHPQHDGSAALCICVVACLVLSTWRLLHGQWSCSRGRRRK
jgi:hypothetical protein